MSGQRDGGFALLELLVALALLGLIVVMVGSSVRDTVRVMVTGESRLAASLRVDAVQGLLRRQLSATLPLYLPAGSQEAPVFAGDDGALIWATRRPSTLLVGGVYLARLVFEPAPQGQDGQLLASWQLLDPSRPIDQQRGPVETVRLLDQIAAARFFYYGRTAAGEVGWQPRWTNRNQLPALVRIEVQPAADATWRWPPLIIAPQLTDPAATAASEAAAREYVEPTG